jgi:hypothetical protein
MKLQPNPLTLEFLFGGVSRISIGIVCAVLLLTACAVRIFAGQWPKRIWTASILLALFVFCIEELLPRFAARGAVVALSAFAVFGALFGYWIKSAQRVVLAEPAGLRGGT